MISGLELREIHGLKTGMDPDLSDILQRAVESLKDAVKAYRVLLDTRRKLVPEHAEFRPDFDSYERRLVQIEDLLKEPSLEDYLEASDLQDDLELDVSADFVMIETEIKARLIRSLDQIDARFEGAKFEMPSEVRDDFEDMMQPYHDGIREEVLAEMPIEMRSELEEARRKLRE